MTASRTIVVAFLAILSGCSGVSTLRQPPQDAVQRVMAMDAVNRLGEALNRGACPAIYADASQVFQELEPAADWRTDCAELRRSLGSLQSFAIRAAFVTGPATVLVDGTAMFTRGPCHLGTTWILENGHVRLGSFYLQGPAGPMKVPSLRNRVRPRSDPPTPPSPPAVAA